MLKSDQGAFPLLGLASDEEPTTFFVVERDADARIRPFYESLDNACPAWLSDNKRAEGKKEKHKDIIKRIKLNRGTFLAKFRG
jgi:hypothetical protein